MICTACQTENSDTAAFCSNCGGLLIKSATSTGSAAPAPTVAPTVQIVPQTTSGKAVASLVLALLGLSLLAVIFGHIARGEIRRSDGRMSGDGLALAGLIIGWIGMGFWFLFWFLIILAAALM
jgi:VIT1/CCC1 family predicted Fe2+/Mn2+ transporter